MLPLQKNKDIMQQLRRVVSRAQHVREVKNQLFGFIHEVQKLNSSFAQKISKEMTKFEQFVIKNSLYYEKTDHIVNLSKLYREFSLQIERNSKINLISIQNIRQDNIEKVEEKLRGKCEACVREFQRYSQQELAYNQKYGQYALHCDQLTRITTMYRSYENPIAFYQKILTNQYLSALDKKHQQCSTSESEIVTSRQMIDEQRGNLTENIKDVNEVYFIFVHSYLDIIEKIIKCIVYPKNQGKVQKTELNLRNTAERDNIEEHQIKELQRLENLYANEAGKNHQANDLFQQFSQLFRKSVNQNQISSDHRFFYDRCNSIRTKKLKTSEQTYKLQNYLFDELKLQRESYYQYEKSYKHIEKEVFANNGVESYKKRFRKYFGANYAQTLELCLNLIERQKRSLEKICKNMEQGHQKMKKVLQNKKQAFTAFQKRSLIILQDHLRIKEKTCSRESINTQELHRFKTSISQSFNELKKVFMQLQKSQRQDDKRYFVNLKSLYETIMKEATNKNLNKLLDKEKNRINILNSISIDRETLSILKEDARYQNLLNQCPKPNLYSTFVSLINKVEVEETTLLLKKKEARLKNMIKPKLGCCGLKSEVIKQKVHSQHECKLRSLKEKYKGTLNISELGLIFEQNSWNPFAEGLQLVIPQSDIKSFDIKQFQQKEVVQIETQFGALDFESKQNATILKSIQNNINFKPVPFKQLSQRGKRNDSSSFIKNNTSTEFKVSYDKTINSNQLSRVINNVNAKLPPEKPTIKAKSAQNQLKDLARKWRDGQFLPTQKFSRVQKPNQQKNQMRRDYQYKQGHSKFYMKERRQCKIVEKDLVMRYEWKISFPESPMLHSFKHHQEIRVENAAKDLRVRIITAKYVEEQLYIKNKFYKEIEEMNKLISQFVVLVLQKEADVINQLEEDEGKSIQSFNIVVDDINLEERDSKFERTESMLRNSRLERPRSSICAKSSL